MTKERDMETILDGTIRFSRPSLPATALVAMLNYCEVTDFPDVDTPAMRAVWFAYQDTLHALGLDFDTRAAKLCDGIVHDVPDFDLCAAPIRLQAIHDALLRFDLDFDMSLGPDSHQQVGGPMMWQLVPTAARMVIVQHLRSYAAAGLGLSQGDVVAKLKREHAQRKAAGQVYFRDHVTKKKIDGSTGLPEEGGDDCDCELCKAQRG